VILIQRRIPEASVVGKEVEQPGAAVESRRVGNQGGEMIAKIVEDEIGKGELHFDIVPVVQSGVEKGSETDEIVPLLDRLVCSKQTKQHPQPFFVAPELRPQRGKSHRSARRKAIDQAEFEGGSEGAALRRIRHEPFRAEIIESLRMCHSTRS
jgi:hypothetical protein